MLNLEGNAPMKNCFSELAILTVYSQYILDCNLWAIINFVIFAYEFMFIHTTPEVEIKLIYLTTSLVFTLRPHTWG